jgi:hypothetical protein
MPARSDEDICNMALLHAGVNQRIGSLLDASAAAQACNTVYAEYRRQMHNEFRWPHAIKRVELFPYTGATYDPAQTWNLGDLTQYGRNVYRSLQGANIGNQPDLDASAAWWAQVTRDGYAYVCPTPDDMMSPVKIWQKPTVSQFGVPQPFFYPAGCNFRNPLSEERLPYVFENANDGTDQDVLLSDAPNPILQYVADIPNPSSFPPPFVEAFSWKLAVPLAIGLRGDEKKAAACTQMFNRALAAAFASDMRDQQEDVEPISEFEASRHGGW